MVNKEETMFIKEIKRLLKDAWSVTAEAPAKNFLEQFRFWNVVLTLIILLLIYLLIFFYN